MNRKVARSPKLIAFSCISSVTLEDVTEVERLILDGRTDLIAQQPENLGGMGRFAVEAICRFDTDAALAWGGLVGSYDETAVRERLASFNASRDYLIPVPNKQTNRSSVITDGVSRLIVRRVHQIDWEDLGEAGRAKLEELVRISGVCLLGNLPIGLTRDLIGIGRDEGTYVALGAGSRQQGYLADLQPHMLTLNFNEAQKATGLLDCEDVDQVFDALCDGCRFDHVGVMTGNGSRPTKVCDRLRNGRTEIAPLNLDEVPDSRRARRKCLGTGDTMAGALAFVLGGARELAVGDKLKDAVSFAQDVVVAHMTGSPTYHTRIQQAYRAWRRRAVSRSTRNAVPATAR